MWTPAVVCWNAVSCTTVRPAPTALISKSDAIWLPWSSWSEATTGLVSPTSTNTTVGAATIPEGFLKPSVGSPEQDRNPTAATSTTEPRNKRFIVNTSVRRSSKDASRIVRLKLLPYAGIVAPAQAEQIDPEELPGVVHGFAADYLAPRRNPGLAKIVRKDQLIRPKAGAIGKDVVGPLAAGVAPYLVRRGSALVLLPEYVVRGPAPGEDPAPIRPPPRHRYTAPL